ncbi:MAG: hypothetical protein IJT91_00845 [Clostridia bacterium]|nr:hypothetical protein [Clostridia bacterium]
MRDFGGLNKLGRIGDNEFSAMENVGAERYPALSVRGRRSTLADLGSGSASLFFNEGVGWLTGSGSLFYKGEEVTGAVSGQGVEADERVCVNMGSKVLFFPDKTYFDVISGECGSLEETFTSTGASHAMIQYIFDDGDAANSVRWENNSVPANPLKNDVYFYRDDGGCHVYRYNEYGDNKWYPCYHSRYKFIHSSLPGGFREGDTVRAASNPASTTLGLDLSFEVDEVGEGYIVLRGENHFKLIYGMALAGPSMSYKYGFLGTVSRSAPDVAFACVCGNRVWGGAPDGHTVYASKLGDPFNWNAFDGIASDSYAVTIGSDGPFTGCISYDGKPVFFKNDCAVKIYGDKPSNFSVSDPVCHGVAPGSAKSLTLCEDTLFYLGSDGVYAYGGSTPVCVSDKLGGERLSEGIGGCFSGRYYLSALDSSGKRSIYVFDPAKKLWSVQDDPGTVNILSCEDDVYISAFDGEDSALISLGGKLSVDGYITGGIEESDPVWYAQTGRFFVSDPFTRRISKIWLSLDMAENTYVKIRAEYNGSDEKYSLRSYTCTRSGQKKICFAPRRCADFRLIIEGKGACELLSVSVESSVF